MNEFTTKRLPVGFHLVPLAESEDRETFNVNATMFHRNGTECRCPAECRESREATPW